jgi:hypothetical protein
MPKFGSLAHAKWLCLWLGLVVSVTLCLENCIEGNVARSFVMFGCVVIYSCQLIKKGQEDE